MLTPNAEVVTLETAGVDDLFAKANPVPKEAVDDVLPTPNPVKDDPPPEEDAAGAAEALATAAEEAAEAPKAGTDGDKVVLPVPTVEAVVVVTVENSGAEDVVNENEPGALDAGAVEATEAAEEEAEAEPEATLGNPKEG